MSTSKPKNKSKRLTYIIKMVKEGEEKFQKHLEKCHKCRFWDRKLDSCALVECEYDFS